MEVLQCDGCDFRAPSYEDLKAHIQDVHTAFLQPTDVAEDNANEARSGSMNASNQTEVEFSSIKDEFAIAEDLSGKCRLNSAYLIYFITLMYFELVAMVLDICSFCSSESLSLLSHFCGLGIMFFFFSILGYCPFDLVS